MSERAPEPLNPVSRRMVTTVDTAGVGVISIETRIFPIHLFSDDHPLTDKRPKRWDYPIIVIDALRPRQVMRSRIRYPAFERDRQQCAPNRV